MLYDEKQYRIIKSNIEDIEKKANQKIDETLIPTWSKKMEILKKVQEYVKNKGMIVYGGTAQNELICVKKTEDCFYDRLDIKDVEFYSSNPLKDISEMADFFSTQYNNVQAREAQHEATFTLFIEFEAFCDVTYMPQNVMERIPTKLVNGYKTIHPLMAVMDALRIYSDPMRSYWVLEKVFERSYRLMRHYPLKLMKETNTNFGDFQCQEQADIMKYLMTNIISQNHVVVFGLLAYQMYLYYVETNVSKNYKTYDVKLQYLDIFTTKLYDDVNKILYDLKSTYKQDLFYREYHPFFQYTGTKISFYYKKHLILNIYSNNHQCIPYHKIKLPMGLVRTANFHMVLLMFLVHYFETLVHENKKHGVDFQILASNFLKLRYDFFKHTKTTPLDPTMFQEFKLKCKGKTISFQREALLRIKQKVEKKQMVKWQYSPLRDKSYRIIKMPNIDGTPVRKTKRHSRIV